MARFINPFPQYINISGSPINGGFLKFFDTGTSSPKNVFSDANLSTSIGSDVRLSASGRVPSLFLNGAYRVVLTDKDGNELDSADPIGVDTDIVNFDLWLSTNTYNIPDIVKGSDDLYYQSTADANLNNDPTVSPTLWEQFYFLPTWSATQTYASGQIVIGSDGNTYNSQVGSNAGNDPTLDDGTNWKGLLQEGDEPSFGDITIAKLDAESKGLKYTNDDVLRWDLLFDASEDLSLNRYDGTGVLIDSALSFDIVTGAGIMANQLTVNSGDITALSGNIKASQDGNAIGVELDLSSDALQQSLIAFRDAGVDRYLLGQDIASGFRLSRFDAAGNPTGTILEVVDGSSDIIFEGNLQFDLTNLGIEVVATPGGSFDFNFTALSLNTEDTAFDFFNNTTTTGERLLNVYQGDGTATVTCQVNAETGSIHPAFDRAGDVEPGVKLNKITLSVNAPTGGEDGDLWLRY